MPGFLGQPVRRLTALGVLLGAAACAVSAPVPTASAPSPTAPDTFEPTPTFGSTTSLGGGDPRTSAYWITWSTCGEGSQAEVARQNGGRAAGWILLDDLLQSPGLALGDRDLVACDEAVAVLSGGTRGLLPGAIGELPRQILTAELNLSSGGETCVAAENAVVLGQGLLTAVGFDGTVPARAPSASETGLVDDIVEALMAYNSGELCR